MSAPQEHQAPVQDAQITTQEPQRATETSVPAVPAKSESPLPVKGLPPNPKSAKALQDEQSSKSNSSRADGDPPQYDRLEGYVMVHKPSPPLATAPSSKDKEAYSGSPVPIPRQVPARSDSGEQARHRPESPRNHKDQRRTGEELMIEISRREEEKIRMVQYIDKLHDRISSMESEITALNTNLTDTEHALHSIRQDLSASRAFVASEGSVDAQFLIKMMRDLNGSIDDFAFQLMEIIPEAALTRKVSRDGLENLGKSFEHARKITTFINQAYKNSVTVGDFVQPFVQYALCMRLLEVIFSPWVPGMPREKSDIFHGIYNLVHQREAQERSARWRAITYSHAWPERDDKRFCEMAGSDMLSRFVDSLGPLCAPDEISFDTLKSTFGETVSGLFMDAIKFQDKARVSYMSFDYTPMIPRVDEPFNPMFMETNQEVRQGSKHKSSNAILPVGFGLQAWKSVVREDKSIGKEIQVALKSQVICGTWAPSAS